jgi:hypothetical protein
MMDIEEFAKKYLDLKLKPYQIEWLKRILDEKEEKVLFFQPRMSGRSYDLVIFDDIKHVK